MDIKAAVVYTFAAGFAVFFCRALPFFIIRPGKGRGKGGRAAAGDSDTTHGNSNTVDKNSNAVGGGPARGRTLNAFLTLIERVVPPVAMTVLAVNSIAAPVKENPAASLPVLAASALTLGMQLWKRNYLVSILGGTAAYMVLTRLLG
jgi:branched-subunit amino acid transport protein AzlD